MIKFIRLFSFVLIKTQRIKYVWDIPLDTGCKVCYNQGMDGHPKVLQSLTSDKHGQDFGLSREAPDADLSDFQYASALNIETECSRCSNPATQIVLGKENEFIGFYCLEHSVEKQNAINSKYQFEAENKTQPVNCLNCDRPFIRRFRTQLYCKNKCKSKRWRVNNPEKIKPVVKSVKVEEKKAKKFTINDLNRLLAAHEGEIKNAESKTKEQSS